MKFLIRKLLTLNLNNIGPALTRLGLFDVIGRLRFYTVFA